MNTQRVIVQVPMQATLKKSAEAEALSQGFSSLQEAIRVFLHKLSQKELTMTIGERSERLSPKAEARYAKMVKEMKEGKVKTKSFTDVDAMFSYLNT